MVLRDFAGVAHQEIPFDPAGITVIQGPNESGKSTVLKALDLLLHTKGSSRASAVKAVQPEGQDVGPSVSADFSTGPYRITYSKRWLKDPRSEAQVAGPAGTQRLTGDEAHDRVTAILGETMDGELWAAFRVQQGTLAQGASLPRSAALQRALDAASQGGLGGAQETALLERASAERDRYLTAKTGKPRGEYEEALKERLSIRAALEPLAQRLADVQRLVDAIPLLVGERTELERREVEARDLVAGAERAMARLQAEATEVARLGQRAADAERAHGLATSDLADLRRCRADLDKARGRLNAVEARRLELADVAVLRGIIAQSEHAAREAQASDDEARRIADAAQRDIDHLHRVAARDQWGVRLKAARDADGNVAACRKTLEGIRVTAADVRRLEEAQARYDKLHAQEQIQLPAIVVTAQTDLDLRANGTAVRLMAGGAEHFPITGQLDIDVPGTLRLTVSGGSAVEGIHRATQEAQRLLTDLLGQAGVPHVAAAKSQLEDRRRADGELAHAQQALAAALDGMGLEALQQRASAAAAEVARYLDLRDQPSPLPTTLEEAEVARDRARALVEAAGAHLRATGQALEAQRTALAAAVADQAAYDRELEAASTALEEAERRLAAHRDGRDDAVLEAEERRGREAADAAEAAYAAANADYTAKDPDEVEARLRGCRSALDGVRSRLEGVRDELARKQGMLESQQSDGLQERYEDLAAKGEAAERTVGRLERNAAAARLLCETLERHRAEAFRNHHAPYRRGIERLGRMVFGPDFAVELGEDLVIRRRVLHGVSLSFEQLSTGAQEQIAVLARLAAAEMISDEGVPLILDDSFGYSDPGRVDNLNAVLRQVGMTCQIVLLTCTPNRYALVGECLVVRLDALPAGAWAASAREVAAAGDVQGP